MFIKPKHQILASTHTLKHFKRKTTITRLQAVQQQKRKRKKKVKQAILTYNIFTHARVLERTHARTHALHPHPHTHTHTHTQFQTNIQAIKQPSKQINDDPNKKVLT